MAPKHHLAALYRQLRACCGPHPEWWPTDNGPLREWEICAGAILTQNTNWKNAERALANLKREKLLSPKKIATAPLRRLENAVRPSGFYKQKSERLRALASFILSFGSFDTFFRTVTRDQLLALKGIGPETADSILLYACNKPYFVIDAYTRRTLSRLKLINGKESYDELQRMFHGSLPRSAKLYKEFHALVVEHAKRLCRKKPGCAACPLKCPSHT